MGRDLPTELVDELFGVLRKGDARRRELDDACAVPDEFRLLPVDVPSGAPKQLRELAKFSHVNFLPRVEAVHLSMLEVNGISINESEPDGAWDVWQRSRLDSKQDVVHHSAVRYGRGYVGARRDGNGEPVLQPFYAGQVALIVDEWDMSPYPFAALRVGREHAEVWDRESWWRFRINRVPFSSVGPDLEVVDSGDHGLGLCPFVEFRLTSAHRHALDGGIIDVVRRKQRELDQVNYQLAVARYVTAFRQLYVSGWKPGSEEEELRLSMGASMWYFDKPDVKVNAVEPGDIDVFLKSRDSILFDMFRLANLSLPDLGVESAVNVNSDALVSSETPKTRLRDSVQKCMGESWEDCLRIGLKMRGDLKAFNDVAAEVSWDDKRSVPFGALVDGVVKLKQVDAIDARTVAKLALGLSDQAVGNIAGSYGSVGVSSPTLDALKVTNSVGG